jgi:hypothetical protein
MSMQSKPLSIGNGPIKSMVMLLLRLSGTGRGWRGPAGFVVRDLFHWHSEQEGM